MYGCVFFSGLAVMISIGGLFLLDDPLFRSMAVGTISVVFVAVVGSLTFLPATLAILGDGVNRLRLPFIGRDRQEGSGIWATLVRAVITISAAYTSRLVDTRVGDGGRSFGVGEQRQILSPRPGLMVANVTAVGALMPGWIAVYSCGAGYQGTSTVNYPATAAFANATIVDASTGVCAKALTSVDVIIDVTGTIS